MGAERERDLQAASQHFAIVGRAGPACLIFGAGLGRLLFDWNLFVGAFILGIPLALVAWALTHTIVDRAGHVARSVYNPVGDGTSSPGGLSLEETLIVTGRLDEAVEALTRRALEDPADPRFRIRLAELYRDERDDPLEAAAWFRRAAAVPDLDLRAQRQILRELVELCAHRIGDPSLAIPALSRTAELHAGDRLGHWARGQLREIRATRADTEREPGPT